MDFFFYFYIRCARYLFKFIRIRLVFLDTFPEFISVAVWSCRSHRNFPQRLYTWRGFHACSLFFLIFAFIILNKYLFTSCNIFSCCLPISVTYVRIQYVMCNWIWWMIWMIKRETSKIKEFWFISRQFSYRLHGSAEVTSNLYLPISNLGFPE
jgi:hypothetical protein